MKAEEFCDILADIDAAYVQQAHSVRTKRRPRWPKWAAACLAAIVVFAVLPFSGLTSGRGGADKSAPAPDVIEFNGAYYEVVDMRNTEALDAYDLPHKITPDMIGRSLGSAQSSTQRPLYEYLPYAGAAAVTGTLSQERAQRAVYVAEQDGAYAFVLFCNFLPLDSNTHTEAREMFAVYGIDSAEDISCVDIGTQCIRDTETISQIFHTLCQSAALGNDDFQNAVFRGLSPAEEQALHTGLADSAIEIHITTAEGLVIRHISYYPSIQYVYWALNYYRLNAPLI
jgi:hypothetical protein